MMGPQRPAGVHEWNTDGALLVQMPLTPAYNSKFA